MATETIEDLNLPGSPGPALLGAWEGLQADEKAALLPHLLGSTGANWISRVMTEEGHPVGATSIKNWRKTLAEAGV